MILESNIAEQIVAGPDPVTGEAHPLGGLADYSRITPEAAAVLAAGYRGEQTGEAACPGVGSVPVAHCEMDLSGLGSINTAVARALARWNPRLAEPDEAVCKLFLGGLRHASARAWRALAEWSVSAGTAHLVLSGVWELDVAGARALGRWSGGNRSSHLHLDQLPVLTPEAAAELTAGYLESIVLGGRTVTLETAVLLGQAGYGRITLSRPDRIGPDALLALGGLTPDGRPRPERASPEFARAKPLELYLGERGDLLRQPTRETLMAISLLRRAGVKVPLSRAAERALRALR